MPSTNVKRGVYWSERTRTWHYEVRIHGKKRNGDTGHVYQQLAIDYVRDLRRASNREKDGLPPEVQTPTLRQALAAWDEAMKGKVEDRHRGDMRRLQTHAAAFLDTPLNRLDNRAVDGPEGILATYLKTIGTGYHDAKLSHTLGGANTLLKLLRSLCGWAITQGLLIHRPFTVKDRKVREEPRGVVWPELMQRFCQEADRGGRGRTEEQKAAEELHSAVAIRIMLALGVREDECLNAEWSWIDWGTAVYTVKKTKNRRIRAIPMPAWLVTYLEALWVKAGRPAKGLILPDKTEAGDRPHGKNFTAKPVARCARKLGIPDLTPHRLRATFATTHYEAGTPLSQISQMMGHTGKTAPATTMGYIVQRPKAQAESQEKVALLQGFQSPISPPKKDSAKPKKSKKTA